MVKMPLNIGVDIDGVIIDFISEFIKTYHSKYPRYKRLKKEYIRRHSLESVLGLFEEEVYDLIERTTVYGDFKLIPGADRVLSEFTSEGDNIYICTSRPERHRLRTIELLDNLDIPRKKLIFKGNGKKLDVILKEMPHFDIFIEDNLAEAIHLSKLVSRVLVFRQPWNNNCMNVRGSLKYVNSWDEIRKTVSEYRRDMAPTLL